jgi:hypothetical protein
VDCPTEGWIYGCEYYRDFIVVFFDDGSVWKFVYTGSSGLPFRWDLISREGGSVAPFATAIKEGKAYFLDKTAIKVTDTYDIQRIDKKVPSVIYDFDQNNAEQSFMTIIEELKQLWLLYPKSLSSTPDRVLALNYEDFAWSKYTMPFSVIGFYWQEDTLTWGNASGTWEDQARIWVEPSGKVGYPVPLAGDPTTGTIYQLNNGTDDDGSDIEAIIDTGQWNPYTKEGRKARLGYVDFLVTCDSQDSFTIDFYKDWDDSNYLRKTLDFNRSHEKSWVRMYCGAIASSHRLRIYHTESGMRPVIHAIMPYFKPVGKRMINNG